MVDLVLWTRRGQYRLAGLEGGLEGVLRRSYDSSGVGWARLSDLEGWVCGRCRGH